MSRRSNRISLALPLRGSAEADRSHGQSSCGNSRRGRHRTPGLPPAGSLFAVAAVLCLWALPAEGDEKAAVVAARDTEQLIGLDGRKAVVHGHVESTGKSPGGTNFVNFRDAEFSLVTFRSDLDQFPEGEPVDLYSDRRLAVEGVVAIYQGRPQIKLTSPDQVRLLGEDEEFPPKADAVPETPAEAVETSESGSVAAAGAPGEEGTEAKEQPEAEVRRPPVDPSLYFR